MRSRLDSAALILPSTLASCREPPDALDALHSILMSSRSDLSAYAAWRLPRRLFDWRQYQNRVNVLRHLSVPAAFWPEFFSLLEIHGATPMAKRAWLNAGAFTWSECMRDTNPRGEERWIFDVLHRHGMRDGYYIPAGRWVVALWSPHVLRLTAAERASLEFCGLHTARRLEAVTRQNDDKSSQHQPLTARELQVVERMSVGDRTAEIAKHLHLSVPSVRTYETRAMKKLGARTQAHMVAEAMRVMLLR